MRFESPWMLLLLALIPLLAILRTRRRLEPAIRFPSIVHALAAGRSWKQRLAWSLTALRIVALSLTVIALARPQLGQERLRDASQGVAIEMVVDRSGSMAAEMSFGDGRMNRLEVVKRVFQEFVFGNGRELKGRGDDLVGLVAFARYADTVCPLTLAHGALGQFLETVHLAERREEDGTSIGDAIALAAARLHTAGETLAKQVDGQEKPYEIKSKVIILLTDGQHNFGQRDPMQAASMAADWGIRIHAIGVGGEAVTAVQTPLGRFMMPTGSDLDERTLTAIAERTGGIYRKADDAESLRQVYEEIDRLEKTNFEAIRYIDYKEAFAPFAIAALAALVIEIALACTVFRKIP